MEDDGKRDRESDKKLNGGENLDIEIEELTSLRYMYTDSLKHALRLDQGRRHCH